MKIIEIFKTIQGEGVLVGTVSVMVRLWGCNLKCKWCDEKFSLKPGTGYEISISDLLKKINSYDCKNVIITGGEPLIYPDIVELTNELKKRDYHITIETNATIKRKIKCDLISMSPKLSHSVPNNIGDARKYDKIRMNIDAIKYYIKNHNYQIKFVIMYKKDLDEVEKVLLQIGDYNRSKILIMPLASSRRQLFNIQKEVVKMCIEKNLRYCNRLQLQIWGKNKEVKK